jgi:anti-sigma factor RsiW
MKMSRRLRQIQAECREGIRHLSLRDLVEAYVDDELADDDRTRVAAHIDRCWICSDHACTIRLMKRSLSIGPRRAPVPLAMVRLRRYANGLATAPGPSGRPDP